MLSLLVLFRKKLNQNDQSDDRPFMNLSLKVVVIGDSSVGKTCISLRYLTGEFANQTHPTIAAGFCNAQVKLGKKTIDLLIWDTAGQEAYRGLTSQYYRDAKIALITFDLTNSSTLSSVKEWYNRIKEANSGSFITVLVGNKSDLPNRQVTQEEALAQAEEIQAIYRETSAVTGKGITEVFEDACEEYIKANPPDTAMVEPTSIHLDDNGKKSACSC